MPAPARQAHSAREHRHLDGAQPVCRRPVTELAAIVASPGPDGAVRSDCQGVLIPGRNGRNPRNARDDDGAQPVCRRPIADLTVIIPAPGPDRAGRCKGDGVIRPGRHRDDVGEGRHLGRHILVHCRPITELAERIVPPGPDGAVRFEGNRESVAGGDGCYVRKVGQLAGGSCAGLPRTIPQFAAEICAPRPDGVVAGVLQRILWRAGYAGRVSVCLKCKENDSNDCPGEQAKTAAHVVLLIRAMIRCTYVVRDNPADEGPCPLNSLK